MLTMMGALKAGAPSGVRMTKKNEPGTLHIAPLFRRKDVGATHKAPGSGVNVIGGRAVEDRAAA
jgi:hypothetical protein